jgi:hypothetical protein
MAGILFLRDIDVDIQMRCRACGHEGLLARGDLERRFGPSYPVLSIAPHYRCSRCHSKDVESSPGPPAAPPPGLDTARDEDTVEAGIAALQGLLDAVRGGHPYSGPPHSGPHPGKDSVEEDEDGIVDLMPQLREAEVAPEDEGNGEEADGDDAGDDLFERTMAALRAVARPEPEPEPDTVAAEDEDVPFDRSLAALRDLIGDEALDEDAPANEPPGPPAAPPAPDPRAVIAELLEEEEEHEPIFRPRAGAPPPSASEMEMSLAALRALVEKAAEDGPEPEPEAEPEPEPEPEEPEPARARPQPAAHTDDEPFDETIAALRSLIADRHRDADDDPPPEEDERTGEDPEELDDISDAEILSFAIRDPELAPADDAGEAGHAESAAPAMPEEEEEEPAPPPPPPPVKTSHLSETLAKLRGMLELDRPDKNGDHRHGGHRHDEDRPRRR